MHFFNIFALALPAIASAAAIPAADTSDSAGVLEKRADKCSRFNPVYVGAITFGNQAGEALHMEYQYVDKIDWNRLRPANMLGDDYYPIYAGESWTYNLGKYQKEMDQLIVGQKFMLRVCNILGRCKPVEGIFMVPPKNSNLWQIGITAENTLGMFWKDNSCWIGSKLVTAS